MKRAMLVLLVACARHDTSPDPFWAYFVDHAAALHAEPLETAMTELQHALDPVHPGVLVELASDGAQRTLVLTADGDRARFPAVEAVWQARPTIAGWDVVAFRQRERERPLSKITSGDRTLDPNTARFVAERAGDKLDVVLFVPGYTERDAKLAYIALDHVVGEYDAEMRIGAISIVNADHMPARAQPLADLPAELDGSGS